MKTILLLVLAAFVSSAHINDKHLLEGLITELNAILNNLPKEPVEETYLRELKTHICEPKFFCQAEHELKDKVSGLTKYDDFRTDKTLMRKLNAYNKHKHHNTSCKPVDEDQDEITLHKFLENLKACAQNTNSKIKQN